MVHMASVYLTGKQIPCSFWFYTITHDVHMMNVIPGKFKDPLASPFLLVHWVGHDAHMWIPLFSM
jgi:hypothetical protein